MPRGPRYHDAQDQAPPAHGAGRGRGASKRRISFHEQFGPRTNEYWRNNTSERDTRYGSDMDRMREGYGRGDRARQHGAGASQMWRPGPSEFENSSGLRGYGGMGSGRIGDWGGRQGRDERHGYQRGFSAYDRRGYPPTGPDEKEEDKEYGNRQKRDYTYGRRSRELDDDEGRPRPTGDDEGRPRAPRVEMRSGFIVDRRGAELGRRLREEDGGGSPPKRKKWVPGGRIAKYEKAQEYETNLYCDVCEIDMPDANAKSLHDRSKKHMRQMQYKRHEDELENERKGKEKKSSVGFGYQTEPVCKAVPTSANFKEDLVSVLGTNIDTWPKSFKSWAERSIGEAKNAAKGNNAVILAVVREILDTYKVFSSKNELMTQSWERMAAASGCWYRGDKPQEVKDVIVTDEQIKAAKAAADAEKDRERAQLEVASTAAAANVPGDAPSERWWVQGGTEGTVDSVRLSEGRRPTVTPASQAQARRDGEGAWTGRIRNAEADATVEEEGEEQVPDYPIMEEKWRVRTAAKYLYYVSQVGEPGLHTKMYRKRFKSPFAESKAAAMREAEENRSSVEPLVQRYNELHRVHDGGAFEFKEMYASLSKLAQEFERIGTRRGNLVGCLKMQISAAIYSSEFTKCVAPCEELIKLYKCYDELKEEDAEYIGHWLVSLLYKHEESGKRRGMKTPPLLWLNCRLKEMPRGALRFMQVHHALRVVRAVMSNSFATFFKLRAEKFVHESTNDRSRYMMDGLVDVVRERGVVSLAMKGRLVDEVLRDSRAVALEPLVRQLGYGAQEEDHDEEEIAEALTEAKEFVGKLPAGFLVDDRAQIKFQDREGRVAESTTVDVEAILAWDREAWGDAVPLLK